jgi:hypothetical protein
MCAMRHVLQVHGDWLLPSSHTHRMTWRTDSHTIAHYRTMSLELKSPAMKRFVIEMQALPIDPRARAQRGQPGGRRRLATAHTPVRRTLGCHDRDVDDE